LNRRIDIYFCKEIESFFLAEDWRGEARETIVIPTMGPPPPIWQPLEEMPERAFRNRVFRRRQIALGAEAPREGPVTLARRLLSVECRGAPRYLPVEGWHPDEQAVSIQWRGEIARS